MEHLWTALFCTIHLCLGFLAGRGLRGRDPGPIISSEIGPAVAQFQQALGAAQPALLQLPDQFQATVRQLQQSVTRLEEELTREKQRAKTQVPPNERASVKVGTEPGSQKIENDRDKRKSERLGYVVPEFMALFDPDLQSIGDFEQVQCHDLSSTGVSFFLNRHLDAGENLLITLGQQTGGTIMAAKVVYCRPIIVRGEDRYRVGCEFLRRLKGEEVVDLEPHLATVRSVYSITSAMT